MTSTVPTIGFLGATSRPIWDKFVTAFENQLATLGLINHSTIEIDYKWAFGQQALYDQFAAEFVRSNVNIIVTSGTAPALACKNATAAKQPPIPVVFAAAGNPVDCGLIDTLQHPGGNLTGLGNQQANLVIKRLDVLREWLTNDLGHNIHVGVVGNENVCNVKLEMKIIEEAAPDLGLKVSKGSIEKVEDIEPVINDLKKLGVNVLFVCTDPLITTNAELLNELATDAGLATMHAFREYVDDHGGLMSYGPNFPDMFQRAAKLVDRILKGESPAEIAVEQPDTFEFVKNKKIAKALGLKSLF